jgi:hypothetical protein
MAALRAKDAITSPDREGAHRFHKQLPSRRKKIYEPQRIRITVISLSLVLADRQDRTRKEEPDRTDGG